MANFLSIEDAVVSSTLEFTELDEGTLQQFFCIEGELAAFRIISIDVLDGGVPFLISQVYNSSTGEAIQVGNVSVIPGIDLTGGYFSSGCFCDGDPLASGTRFFKVDY
jgi:hypothetical protein